MSVVQKLRRSRLRDLLTTTEPQTELQETRIRFLERNVGLPTRSLVICVLLYYLFFTPWFQKAAVGSVREPALLFVQRFFLVYMVLNVGVGSLLLGMSQVPFRVIRWLVCLLGLVDALFLSSLTLITGGYDSVFYWVLLGLIVRNAFSIPMALPQILLNLSVPVFYLLAGLKDMALTAKELAALEITQEISDLPADPTQTFVARILLMLLMTACCYGVQVLLDKQRRVEAEAREFAVRQEQLHSAGRLAAEIAHQIKNPLGIINNAAFTLQRNVKEGKGTITQQIKIIREEVERSDRIITDLMGYAQLMEGRVERLDVVEELDRAIDRVFPAAVKFDVEVRRDYASALPPLLIQRNNLSEIFVNLLQNAREAMTEPGVVHVSAKHGEDYSVVVTIADSGPGIPPEIREKIFEPYYTTKTKGTGMGLAIVKHNIEMHGGTVQVESELGKGTRFVLRFPARAVLRLRR